MKEITEKSKLKFHWKALTFDYSPSKMNEIRSLAAKKYGVPKDNVTVVFEDVLPDISDGETLVNQITTENIQDPSYQKELYKEYIRINNITDYDKDFIDKLDNDINSYLDFSSYESHRRFSVKWIKWSNFKSYGPDNFFDFSTLNGLVLLNGEPANESGKTTFAVDLLHFLLFGGRKFNELFNCTLPEETQMTVEGLLVIDGEEYIIKRIVSRPALNKRKETSRVSQKVEYYKCVGDSLESLGEVIEENGEDSIDTSKIIKERLGGKECERDFDLIMCVVEKNLDALIDEGATERGNLFSRWIGLLPLEDKYQKALEKNKEFEKSRLLTLGHTKDGEKEYIEANNVVIKDCNEKINKEEKSIKDIDKELEELNKKHRELIESQIKIDTNVLNIDITTLNSSIEKGKQFKKELEAQIESIKKEIKEIGDVEFSNEEYENIKKSARKKNDVYVGNCALGKKMKESFKEMKSSGRCPTCGREYDEKMLNEKKEEILKFWDETSLVKKELDNLNEKLELLEKKKKDNDRLGKISATLEAAEAKLEACNNKLSSLEKDKEDYKKNKDAIDKNNKLNIEISIVNENIKSKNMAKSTSLTNLGSYQNQVKNANALIKTSQENIVKLEEEEKIAKNWKLYLDMLGKNGISKMVMEHAIPLINTRINQLLDGVCDFEIEVQINTRKEVQFYITKDGVTRNLNSASGFERTTAALALRTVLANISTIPRMNFIILDEVLGRVASENYDNMKLLYDRITSYYDFVFHITHINDIVDWHTQTVTAVMKDGVSKLKQVVNKPNVEVMELVDKKKETKKRKSTKK